MRYLFCLIGWHTWSCCGHNRDTDLYAYECRGCGKIKRTKTPPRL